MQIWYQALSRSTTNFVVSDHCINYGQSPFFAAEASLLHPNDLIYDSVFPIAGRISDDILASDLERSPYVQYDQGDNSNHVLPNHENVGVEKLTSQFDYLYEQSTESTKYIDPYLLTRQEHEPQDWFPSEISQPIAETLAQSTQSQSLFDLTKPKTKINTSTSVAHLTINDDCLEWDVELKQAPSSSRYTDPSQSPISSSSVDEQVPSDKPEGKIEISATSTSLMCPTCQESFSTALRYRKHMGALACHMPFSCHDCGRKFKKEKDLQRHRGHAKAASSCPKLRNSEFHAKPFACTCNSKAYTRKDSLLRHLRKHARDGMQHHRCRACNRSPCTCASGVSR